MKNNLTFLLLFFANVAFAQFYDDFSDGNYTENPRWFMSDMDVQIIENNNNFTLELHPTGDIANSQYKKGSFRTTNTLTDNTWWGCDLTFDINKDSEGEISFYIASSLPSLGESSGTYLKINILSRSIYLVYCDGKTLKPIMESKKQLPYGEINFLCKIIRNGSNWNILCSIEGENIEFEKTTLNTASVTNSTSCGFLLFENPDNPYNLRINSVNCGDKPTETELINTDDIVITEIMAKPNPSVQLPEVEWVEIYNTTDRTLTLEGCKIITPAKIGFLTDYVLKPYDYAVLCSHNAAAEMSAITSKICITESMPTLNNKGNILTLKNKQNNSISFVEYTDNWYNSEPFKADGGWSLERKDASNPLSNDSTWGPSIDPRGGTPAEQNSITCSMPDELIPCILNFGVGDEKTLQIYFNKPMQGEIIELKKSITISGNSLKSLNWEEPQRQTLHLYLNEPLDSLNAIEISFSGISCISNYIMPDTTITIALPYQAQYMDIIFNELMPYVSDGNSKFIELYNNSNFYIDLNQLMLSNRDENQNLKNSKIFCTTSTILPPHRYAIISPDINTINCPLGFNSQSIYITSTLPSIPSTEGTLVLTDRGGNVIDEVQYSNSWHHPLLSDLHDISLERIDSMAPTQSTDNWSSCSIKNTAGWQNSQNINIQNENSNQHFWLETNTFSPNNDGHQDHLIIHHNLPNNGYTITIDAYTRHGAHVCSIVDNQLLSPQGYTLWNGTNTHLETIPAGLYILVIQASHPNELKITQKLVCIKI